VLNTFLEIYKNESVAKNSKCATPSKNKIRILEALSATGLRSIRYAKEVPGVDEIIANDLMSSAVEMIEKNVKLNGVENIVTPNRADAM
jgi:tRNA (guanine26-N2/guanine27-N2)-dimethyltransferase